MSVTSTNPATGEQRALDLEETSPERVAAASTRARRASHEYARRPLDWREGLLGAMAEELEADAATLVATAQAETALPEARLRGELARTAFQFRFFAEVVRDGAFLGASIDEATDSPMGPLPDLRRVKVPLGPVAVFGSSNFPFAFSVPGGDTASALAAGCAVVIKAHPAHPATSAACFAALDRACDRRGAPEGLVSLVFGLDAGTALVQAPAIAAVGFTGSVAAGRALWALAHAREVPVPFYGELGSANPLVVTAAAARERAGEIGEGVAGSIALGAGQFCTKPGLVFVPAGPDGDALVAALGARLGRDGRVTLLSEGIAENFRRGARSLEVDGGASVLVGGEWGEAAHTSARLLQVDAGRFARESALHAECFGPLAVVVRYGGVDELRTALDAAEPALTFSAHVAEADPDAAWLVEWGASRAGRVVVNGYPTGVGVSWSMHHGGPWPATTAAWATSVGAAAVERWLRPVTYQSVPPDLLPAALRDENALGIPRRLNGRLDPGA
ncbi:MAG TPA: aldehyde dehydrogenase (NADP(+)) [Acidimicrobiales bacterium]|nr:MAG: hypothetical protein B7Z69_03950 [Actinobacteria bacterium 21-73-9]HQU25891.1 aldehyde dehydrogenase (NADP(+)) [Acidimicrobiales bacterium]